MENPIKLESLHPNRDGHRLWSHPSSPEFEFWMVRNPSVHQPNILSADELFVDGVLLPLDLLPASSTPLRDSPKGIQENEDVSAGPEITAPAAASGSRRWKDMFKKAGKETDQKTELASTMTNKKREKKSSRGRNASAASSAELNINIWPFSRSHSAGNSGARPRIASNRKVSSAPCSRSNSGGESKSRKWPASPSRAGVPVGRSSPVWQVRRGSSSTPSEASESRKIGKAKVLKGCKQGTNSAASGGYFGGGGHSRKGSGGSNDGSGVVNLFSFRNLFSKKVLY